MQILRFSNMASKGPMTGTPSVVIGVSFHVFISLQLDRFVFQLITYFECCIIEQWRFQKGFQGKHNDCQLQKCQHLHAGTIKLNCISHFHLLAANPIIVMLPETHLYKFGDCRYNVTPVYVFFVTYLFHFHSTKQYRNTIRT